MNAQQEKIDMSDYIKAKSDQLNADDLVGSTILVKIEWVRKTGNPQQPIEIGITGGFRPWKPCLTERRVLMFAWGGNGQDYVGRSVELVRDPKVMWGGKRIGGVRIQRMSHISEACELPLATSNKKKEPRNVGVLEGGTPSVDPFRGHLIAAVRRAESPWTGEQIKEWLLGGRDSTEIPSYERPGILERAKGPPCEPQIKKDGMPF